MCNQIHMEGISIMNIGYVIGNADTQKMEQEEKIEKWFVDIDASIEDTKLSKRPQLEALLKYIRKGDNIYFFSADFLSSSISWMILLNTKEVGVWTSGEAEKVDTEIQKYVNNALGDILFNVNYSNISKDASENTKNEICPEENGEKYIFTKKIEKAPYTEKKYVKKSAWLTYREFYEKKCGYKTELCRMLASKFNVSTTTIFKWLEDKNLSFTID